MTVINAGTRQVCVVFLRHLGENKTKGGDTWAEKKTVNVINTEKWH